MNAAKILGLVMGLCLLGSTVHANEVMNVDEKINKMKENLSLTDEQAKAVKPILEDYKDKMEAAGKEKEERLAQVLSPDQMKTMKDMHKEMKDKMHEFKKSL